MKFALASALLAAFMMSLVLGQQLTVTTVSVLTTQANGSVTVITTPVTLTVTNNGNCWLNPQGQCITSNVGCTLSANLDYRCLYATTSSVVSSSTSGAASTSTASPSSSLSIPATTTATTTVSTPEVADSKYNMAGVAGPCGVALVAFLL